MPRPRNRAARMRSPSLPGSTGEKTDLVLITVFLRGPGASSTDRPQELIASHFGSSLGRQRRANQFLVVAGEYAAIRVHRRDPREFPGPQIRRGRQQV